MHICVTNDIVENYLSLAHNCKLSMKHAKFGIIDQHMNATCYMQYLTTLANSMLIILFSKMLKFSNFISSKSKNIVKENNEYLRIFLFEMNVSKLINYSMNMNWNGQCTTEVGRDLALPMAPFKAFGPFNKVILVLKHYNKNSSRIIKLQLMIFY